MTSSADEKKLQDELADTRKLASAAGLAYYNFGGLFFPAEYADVITWLRRPRMLHEAYAFMSKFDVAVDVGAHVGTYAVELAKKFAVVHAFEPDHINLSLLYMNTRNLPNVRVHGYALGEKKCRVKMTGKPSSGKSVKFCEVADGDYFGCVMDTLDAFKLKPDLLKIDVEGLEPQVLRGGERTIREHKPVIYIENKPARWTQYGGVDPKTILESFGAKMVCQVERDQIYVWETTG